jgi:hypothetical protein
MVVFILVVPVFDLVPVWVAEVPVLEVVPAVVKVILVLFLPFFIV